MCQTLLKSRLNVVKARVSNFHIPALDNLSLQASYLGDLGSFNSIHFFFQFLLFVFLHHSLGALLVLCVAKDLSLSMLHSLFYLGGNSIRLWHL